MNNFTYVTSEELHKIIKSDPRCTQLSLEELKRRARNIQKCSVCEREEAWRFADTGMCFTCTTGSADASDDYELIKE